MRSTLLSMAHSNAEDESDAKVQSQIWDLFGDRRSQDVIVELVLPPLAFTSRQAPSRLAREQGIWPLPPTSEDTDATGRTFAEVRERLRAMGVSKVTELRSAGSLVARVNRRQVGLISELPAVRRIYANTSI